MKKFIISLLIISGIGLAQNDPSPLVLYWKTLDEGEKAIFLMAYLTQVHETHDEMIAETGHGQMTKWFLKIRLRQLIRFLMS